MSRAGEVRQALADLGKASITDIADTLGIVETDDPRYRGISQALTAGVQRGWAERVGRGQYVSANGSKPAKKEETSSELMPLVDSLMTGDDNPFDIVGLTFVARTQSGAFVCTDRHGVAWLVEVTATARLL